MSDDYDQKYTRPDLRRRLKEEIKASDRGGKPGQWSARKSQMLVQEYEKQGGGYKKSRKDEDSRSLERWTDENWQTREGKAQAREDGATRRYLPEKAWEQLSEEEKARTDRKKQAASRKDRQFVSNTEAAKKARREATRNDDGADRDSLYRRAQELDIRGRSKMDREALARAVAEAEANHPENQSREALYQRARELDIPNRSRMNKGELIQALREARA